MQKYFDKFNKVAYTFDDDKYYLLSDITRNIRFKKELLKDFHFYQVYNIIDGDTPERISEKLYGTPHYHWVIILLNEIEDWVNDFPLSYDDFNKYIAEKYGSVSYAKNTISHYENKDGLIVFYDPLLDTTDDTRNLVYRENDAAHSLPRAVKIYDVEEAANDAKRRIKVLHKNQLDAIIQQYGEML